MRNKLAVLFVAVFALALTAFMMPKKANAIAAFAQKYHFSCAVCHVNGYGGGASLNPFGRAFQRYGFRLPGTNGTPADATDVTAGMSLPNPWPIPVMLEVSIGYTHVTNENVNNSTDAFSASQQLHTGGAFKLYNPLAESLSWYTGFDTSTSNAASIDNTFLVLNGVGAPLGVPSHLINVIAGYSNNMFNPTPYFSFRPAGALSIGYDAGSGVLSEGAGLQIYGTPGYHFWYMVGMTNSAANQSTASKTSADGNTGYIGGTSLKTSGNNAMNYNWRLAEFAPTSVGTLELDYFGGTVAEPLTAANQGSWTNRVMDNGVGVGLSNGIYEIGASYNVISDSNPYTNPNDQVTVNGVNDTSNGYSYTYLYGSYKFNHLITEEGTYLQLSYGTYSWTHKDAQNAFLNAVNSSAYSCSEGLYGTPTALGGTCYEGEQYVFTPAVDVMLAANAYLHAQYTITNIAEEDTFSTTVNFAF